MRETVAVLYKIGDYNANKCYLCKSYSEIDLVKNWYILKTLQLLALCLILYALWKSKKKNLKFDYERGNLLSNQQQISYKCPQ